MKHLHPDIRERLNRIQEQRDNALIDKSDRAFKLIIIFAVIAFSIFFVKFGFTALAERSDVLSRNGPLPWIMKSLPDASRWGQLGDFLGGVLNPAIGLLTVYLLLANARMQKRELANSLEEMRLSNEALMEQSSLMELQNAQSAFFNWLEHYRERLGVIRFVKNGEQVSHGAIALRNLYKSYFAEHVLKKTTISFTTAGAAAISELFETGTVNNPAMAAIIEKMLLKEWEALYEEVHEDLYTAFKTLMALLAWIDSQPIRVMSGKRKNELARIIRSQLSVIELVYLFFVGITYMNDDKIELLKKYKILKEIPKESETIYKFLAGRPNSLLPG